jgi:hypothetical protein
VVEWRAGRHEPGDIGDVDEDAIVVKRQGVVEILRGLGVDREGQLAPQVDASLQRLQRRLERLEPAALALLDEQRLEDGLDPVRTAECPFQLGPSPAGTDEREVARARLAAPLAVDRDRRPGREVGLADEQLAPARQLDYD